MQGRVTYHREASEEIVGIELGIPLIVGVNGEIKLQEYGTYVTRRQNTVAYYILMQNILDLCEQSA